MARSTKPEPPGPTLGSTGFREWRDRADMTQLQVAERLGQDPTNISHLECGRRTPGLRLATKIFELTGVHPGLWLQPLDDKAA